MNILILGSGGREHALAWKISQSKKCGNLYVLPGNAGTRQLSENIPVSVSDFENIVKNVIEKEIDMVIVGPEAPLVGGLRGYFNSKKNLKNILFIGPGEKGALLEGSKDFAKNFMNRHHIPTAASRTFTLQKMDQALNYLKSLDPPFVLKADGLAAGKGVLICKSIDDAEKSLNQMLAGQMFGEASKKVIIEEYLDGIELSVFLLTDGKNYLILPEAKDYKRIGEQDTGPNTGGMGSVSPVGFADQAFLKKVENRIIIPTINGLKEEEIEFTGFIFLGLMNINGDPYVIEYNVRLGDPESQVVLPRIDSDLTDLLEAAGKGRLGEKSIKISDQTAVTVVMASDGYPGSYKKGMVIRGLDDTSDAIVFHAGTGLDVQNTVITNGGRVLAVTGIGKNLQEALDKSYATVSKIQWEGVQFRKDIGMDLLKLGN